MSTNNRTSSDNRGNGNIVLAGLWKTRNGHYASMTYDERNVETALANIHKGGKIIVRLRTPEAMERSNNPNAPVAYLEFVPKEKVEEFKNSRPEGL